MISIAQNIWYNLLFFHRNTTVHHRLIGWPSSGQIPDKCPMCSEIFPFTMTLTDRTVHINDHLPD